MVVLEWVMAGVAQARPPEASTIEAIMIASMIATMPPISHHAHAAHAHAHP